MAIDSAYKTIQHEVGQDALHDVVDQSRFGRPPSRPVVTDKDVKYEERPVGCNPRKHYWLGTTMNNKSNSGTSQGRSAHRTG